jgi:hypothetical protein
VPIFYSNFDYFFVIVVLVRNSQHSTGGNGTSRRTLQVRLIPFCIILQSAIVLILTKILVGVRRLPSMYRKEGNGKSTDPQSQRQTLAQLEHQQFLLSQALLGGATQSQATAPATNGDRRWITATARSSAGPPSTGYPICSSTVARQQQVEYVGSFLPSGEHLPRASHGLPFQHQNQTFAGVAGVANLLPPVVADGQKRIETALVQLQEALGNIPDVEKTDYLEAPLVAPHRLVRIESDPVKFLRFQNFNVEANISNMNDPHPFDSIAIPRHDGGRLHPVELLEEDDYRRPPGATQAVDRCYAVVGSEANISLTNAPHPPDSIGIPRLDSGRLHPVQLAEEDDSKPPAISAVMDAGVTETPETLNEYRLQLQSEMQTLPRAETAMYFDALEAALPQVWEEEWNPDMFLRVVSFNVRLAAKRLAMYWQLRSDSFGPKKIEPLNQTGEGALGRKELTALRTGFVNLLPND